jgi:hypothetical protein
MRTHPLKTGMLSLTMKENTTQKVTEENHTIQCFLVFLVKSTELRRTRTKIALAASCTFDEVNKQSRDDRGMNRHESR